MPESETHKFIKNNLADSLCILGSNVKTEYVHEEGRTDVHAEKNGEVVNIEVVKTHISELLLAKVSGNIEVPSNRFNSCLLTSREKELRELTRHKLQWERMLKNRDELNKQKGFQRVSPRFWRTLHQRRRQSS